MIPTPEEAKAFRAQVRQDRIDWAAGVIRTAVVTAIKKGEGFTHYDGLFVPKADPFTQGNTRSQVPHDDYSDVREDAAKSVAAELRNKGWSDVHVNRTTGVLSWAHPPECAEAPQ